MEDEDNIILRAIISKNNNYILYEIIKQLELIVNDLNNNKKTNIINQIKNIIILINKAITEHKKNTEQLREDIKNLNKEI